MRKGILLFSLIAFILLVIVFVSAQLCEVENIKNVLRGALFGYLSDPLGSRLSSTQIKDLLDFYLNANNQTVDCSILSNISGISYYSLLQTLSNLTAEVIIPNCDDGTYYGKCSVVSTKYCFAGRLVDRCKICGCPWGQKCQMDGDGLTLDERKWGKCIDNIICRSDSECPSGFSKNIYGFYCDGNNLSGLYTEYKCLEPGTVNSTCFNYTSYWKVKEECNISKNEYCFYWADTCQLVCSDKTRYNQCSPIKPLYCENGTLINNCSVCDCPDQYTCFNDGICRNILEKEKTLTFAYTGNQTIYLQILKNNTVLNVEMNLTSTAAFSTLDIGNDMSYEWSSYIYDLHEREWSGGYCGTMARLTPAGKFAVPKEWTFFDLVFPFGGTIKGTRPTPLTVDEVQVLIKPTVNVSLDTVRIYLLDGFLDGMGVTTDASICRISEENVSSECISDPIPLFLDFLLSYIKDGWVEIPVERELTLSPGPWKIIFTMDYPDKTILPVDAGVGIKMCGYQETGNMLFTNLSGRGYYETGSLYIQLVKEEGSDFIAPISNYLASCIEYPEGYCLVPLIFDTDSAGEIFISDVNMTY